MKGKGKRYNVKIDKENRKRTRDQGKRTKDKVQMG